MSKQPRTQVSTDGMFLSTPGVFDDAPEGLRHAFKMQFTPTPIQHSKDVGGRPGIGMGFAIDRALIDFGAIDPAAIDFARAERDCELLREAVQQHPDVLYQALGVVTGDRADIEQIRAACAALHEIGLTEHQVHENGGGILALLAVAACCLLLGGCDVVSHVLQSSPSVQPQVPHTTLPADAGAGDGG